ncbi:MAG: hypothetical protein NTY35_00325 [Planctomycetota bacterium]|nr:hypothetical protein [Planctomycetota bacterium]
MPHRVLPGARVALVACALLLQPACDRAPDSAAGPRTPIGYDFHQDDRLAQLLGGCERTEPFTGDTTDLLPTLVGKLAVAESVVASRVRADLIAAGPAAVPELRRAFQRWFSEPGCAPRLLALLDLAGVARGPEARAMGREGLEHPSESVRTAAARVLSATGTPEDYDPLAVGVARGGNEYAGQAGLALVRCDPARVVREYASWLDDPGFARIVDLIAPSVAPVLPSEAREKLLAETRLPGIARTWLVASSAAAGDAEALRALRAALADANSTLRQVAVQASIASGLAHEVLALAGNDADPTLRTVALEAIAALPDSPEHRSQIAASLSDADEGVRRAALVALCTRSDPAALDRAIELLAGTNDDVALALAALRAALARDEALAERVLARLEDLLQGGARSTGYAIERALGQVPLARAAEILVERGRRATGTIQDLPAHRWYAVQAGNAGAAGRAWIRAQWEVETDPARRMDLLVAGAQEQSPALAEFLERVLASDRPTDAERLLTADLYTRSVPIAVSAPVMKRAALAVGTPELRRAFHCLQWRFYGPEG